MIDDLTKNALPMRAVAPKAIVIHGTGSTIESRVRDYYRSSPDKACPHFFINAEGETYRIAATDRIAWHCSMHPDQVELYGRGLAQWQKFTVDAAHAIKPISNGVDVYKYWRDQWAIQGYSSPLNHPTGQHPNSNSIGVELLCLDRPTPRGFTDVQYEALALLVCQQAKEFNIPTLRHFLLGHSDVNPLTRPGNDPGKTFDWSYLFYLISGIKR